MSTNKSNTHQPKAIIENDHQVETVEIEAVSAEEFRDATAANSFAAFQSKRRYTNVNFG